MTPGEGTLNAYVCRYCGQPDPGEWGTGRRCPKHPNPAIPPYMRECEFCPIPAVPREEAMTVVRQLVEGVALLRDAAGALSIEHALTASHNWLVGCTSPDENTILGYIPEDEAKDSA